MNTDHEDGASRQAREAAANLVRDGAEAAGAPRQARQAAASLVCDGAIPAQEAEAASILAQLWCQTP